MTSYAPNYTPRLRVHYTAAGVQHTIQVRYARGTSGASLTSNVGDVRGLFNLVTGLLPSDFSFDTAEYALTDEDVFNPVAPPAAITGTQDPADYTPIQKVIGTTFTGRAAGSRARLTMFGLLWVDTNGEDGSGNGIVTAAENAFIGSVADYCSIHFSAGSGLAASFYRRCTVKENDHLLKLVRRGVIT